MNTEIEMKAWVDDVSGCTARLEELGAVFVREYDKRDRYFHLRNAKGKLLMDARLRLDGDKAIVTMKEKTLSGGLETNAEREFTVSDPDNLVYLLERSGYKPFIDKHKTGRAWELEGFLLELSHVGGLGDFLEIEMVVDGSADEATISRAEERILGLFDRLGIARSRIEAKTYTSMLKAEQK